MANIRSASKGCKRALAVCVGALFAASLVGPGPAGASGGLRFANVTAAAGIHGEDSRTWGAAWADYDTDGDPDLFIGRHWHPPQFFINQGGVYTLAAERDLHKRDVDRHSCSWGEANLDGRPDLYCVRGAGKGEGEGLNQLFINTDSGLDDQADAFGVTDALGRGRAANWIDYDGDRDLDLFVVNNKRKGAPNVMFRNDGGDGFRRVSVGLGKSVAAVSSSWADWDRDGDPDIIVFRYKPRVPLMFENTGGRFRQIHRWPITAQHWISGAWGDYNGDGWTDLHLVTPGRSVIVRNDRGSFTPVHRLKLRNGRMGAWLDVENDGDLDLFVVQGAAGRVPTADSINRADFLLVKRRGGFVKVTGRSFRGPKKGNGDSVAAADHDRDGRTDVFVTNGYFRYKSKQILLENRSASRNWVGVDLVGPPSNPLGIGAQVRLRAGGKRYRREMTDGFAFRAQSEVGYITLGLGRRSSAAITVKWSDGTRDCLRGAARTIVRLRYGTESCSAR